MSFFNELKRRNVIRVGVAYLVASWLLLQIVDVLVPILDLPGWVGKLVFLFLVVGVVPVLIFSWAYEMTPDGLKPESEVDHDQSTTLQTAKKLDRVTITLLLIVVGVVVIDRIIPEAVNKATTPAVNLASETTIANTPAHMPPTAGTAQQAEPTDGRQSVAVIPFINMSDDQANEYFSDGISEELLNVLVRIKGLRVPSRTSSFMFKDSNKSLSEIGRELGVKHVLEGSVRKAGDRIRVTAQLIEVTTDTPLWSATYTRELDDIFQVQDEIAQAIVDALKLTLSVVDNQSLSSHSTRNVEAYNKYLLGRYLWNKRSGPSLLAAVKPLLEAVELDPDYDEAWAALADTYSAIPEYSDKTAEEFLPLASEAANKALAINPDSARALAGIAYNKFYYEYDWQGAERDFQRAIMLEPGYASARQWYGTMLNEQGRLEEALQQLKLARAADPMSLIIRHVPGYFLLWAMRLDEAEVHYRDEFELGQPFKWAMQNMDMLNTFRGDYDEARRWTIQQAEFQGYDPAADLARIDAIENPAHKERALKLLKQRQDMGDGPFGKALQYALLGEYESALESLEKSFAAGDPGISSINYMRVYDPIRDDPRFQTLLRKVNLLP